MSTYTNLPHLHRRHRRLLLLSTSGPLLDSPVALNAAALDPIRVDAWRRTTGELSVSRAVATVKVDVFDVKGVDVAWDVTEKGQTDVDKEIKSASSDHGDTHGREKNGDEDD